eukprot:Rhum_TRINITY_DN14325_c20_g4::Rhum_TRINITY_DN14325_c20_g4_i1::g.82964::m.82964
MVGVLFSGMSLLLHVAKSDVKSLTHLVKGQSGRVVSDLDDDCTHVVVANSKRHDVVEKAEDADIPCVSVKWIKDCIGKGELLSCAGYLHGRRQGDKGADSNGNGHGTTPPAKRVRVTGMSAEERDAVLQARRGRRRSSKKLGVAFTHGVDEELMRPIVKKLGGVVEGLTPAALSDGRIGVVVSEGAKGTGELAMATMSAVPVVPDTWLFTCLSEGRFVSAYDYEDEASREAVEAMLQAPEPIFKGLYICVQGLVDLPVGIGGVEYLISAGGGAANNTLAADVAVVFKSSRGQLGSVPTVDSAWLIQSVEKMTRLPYDAFLLNDARPASADEAEETAAPAKKKKGKPEKAVKAEKNTKAKKEKKEQASKKVSPSADAAADNDNGDDDDKANEDAREETAAPPVPPAKDAPAAKKKGKKERRTAATPPPSPPAPPSQASASVKEEKAPAEAEAEKMKDEEAEAEAEAEAFVHEEGVEVPECHAEDDADAGVAAGASEVGVDADADAEADVNADAASEGKQSAMSQDLCDDSDECAAAVAATSASASVARPNVAVAVDDSDQMLCELFW